jgi:hypothetical protein
MRFARLVLVPVVAVLHGGCFVGTALEVAKRQPIGTVNLASATLGNHMLTPTVCGSGERQLFFGADFLDSQGITTRLIVDPAGAASLRLFAADHPLDEGLLFRRQDCSRFQLSLDRTGWQVNDVYDLRVSLEFDCRTASGDSAEGSLRVDHCH